ncbi:UNVERIFIED_CONTAM: hypothetical protein FKN15_046051 [Acipenser sinensis]
MLLLRVGKQLSLLYMSGSNSAEACLQTGRSSGAVTVSSQGGLCSFWSPAKEALHKTGLQELNQYLFLVVELSVRYGGTLFYQYHRAFSAKAAATLSADNRIVDWSRSDPDLFTRIFSGIRANACSTCASTAHSSYLCPKAAASAPQPIPHPLPSLLSSRHLAPALAPPTRSQAQDIYGRPIKFSGGRQICNNFNSSVCFNRTCKNLHVCSFCYDAHSRSICPLKAK